MGILDKILGRGWEWYLGRAEKSLRDEDFGEAMHNVKKAESKLCEGVGDEAKSRVESLRVRVMRATYDHALTSAKAFLASKQNSEAARNAIDRALRHALTQEERDAVSSLVEAQLELSKPVDKVMEEVRVAHSEADVLTDSDKSSMYVTHLPFAKAHRYDELGDAFKGAWIALQEGRVDEAIEGLEAVLKEHPGNPDVMAELGRAYHGKGELAKAEKHLTKADHGRADVETKISRVQVLWAMQRFDIAEMVLQAAHDLAPEDSGVLAAIAQHGLLSKDYASGIEAIEVLIETHPEDVSVHRLGGRLYLESGDDDKALVCFEAVNRLFWKVDPQTKKLTIDQNSAAAAAGLYMKRGENLARAAELLDAVRSLTEGETHVAICLQLAQVYEKMGKSSRRLEMIDEAMRFMDAVYEASEGQDRINMCLRYADLCEMRDGQDAAMTGKALAMLNEAREMVQAEVDKGNPLAAVVVDVIQKRIEGEPLPSPEALAERQMAVLKGMAEARGVDASGQKLYSSIEDGESESGSGEDKADEEE